MTKQQWQAWVNTQLSSYYTSVDHDEHLAKQRKERAMGVRKWKK